MKLFENVKGYKTPENAQNKLEAVVGESIDNLHWIIAVKSDGRFVPVVTGCPSNPRVLSILCNRGICVVG